MRTVLRRDGRVPSSPSEAAVSQRWVVGKVVNEGGAGQPIVAELPIRIPIQSYIDIWSHNRNSSKNTFSVSFIFENLSMNVVLLCMYMYQKSMTFGHDARQ